MARRYSGDVRITVTWLDAEDQYRATVSWPDADKTRRTTHKIGRPPASKLAVDSPAAYDEVAHAALSFTLDDLESEGERHFPAASGVNGNGLAAWHVSRRPG